MNGVAADAYEKVLSECKKLRITVSARADLAIRKYWSVAQSLFEDDADYENDSSIVALDYAISQRILPHVNGSGEQYGNNLRTLANLCSDTNLRLSAEILTEIIQRGEDTMQYYQYFA